MTDIVWLNLMVLKAKLCKKKPGWNGLKPLCYKSNYDRTARFFAQ